MSDDIRLRLKPGLEVEVLRQTDAHPRWVRGRVTEVTHSASQETEVMTDCRVLLVDGLTVSMSDTLLRCNHVRIPAGKSYLELQLDDAITQRDAWHQESQKVASALSDERTEHAKTRADLEHAQDDAAAYKEILLKLRQILQSKPADEIGALACTWVERVEKLDEQCKKLEMQLADANARADRNFDAYQRFKKKLQDVRQFVDGLVMVE